LFNDSQIIEKLLLQSCKSRDQTSHRSHLFIAIDFLEPDRLESVSSAMQFLLTVGILGLAMAGLALGLFFKREPISGHCGGSQKITVDGEILTCPTCDGNPENCVN